MNVSDKVSLYLGKTKMSDINFSFGYKGTKENAVSQVKNMEQMAHEKYPQYDDCWELTWQDKGGAIDARLMGMDVTGEFEIIERDENGGDVQITIKLPAMLSMMKDTIESKIKTEIQKMIG